MTTGDAESVRWLLVSITTGADASLRVHVWRQLRKLGAVYLQNSVCLLPETGLVPQTVQRLAARVRDSGGKARVLHTVFVDPAEQDGVIAEQRADRDVEYGEVVERTPAFLAEIEQETARGRATYAEVEESEADLERFDKWLASIRARDYFEAPGGQAAREAVQACHHAFAAFEAAALAADTGTDTGTGSPPDAETAPQLRVVDNS
ncbi:Chromate resistance protein ChrB [Kribbella sp. DT2]|uniref:Chromate resistance protein ChrB n=1 Tax=Kribbella sp. DT2 TaxID=3393427 RepID=UPI003CF1C6EB